MGDLIAEGEKAPAFEVRDHEGRTHRVPDPEGRPVVLYFYPKDDTPGCRAEACGFRDRMPAYRKAGVKVLGVSTQGETEHRDFAGSYDLNFPLLVDEGNEVSKAYGAYGRFWILPINKRVTYLIDGDGVVRRLWESVDPRAHADDVLAAVRELEASEPSAG